MATTTKQKSPAIKIPDETPVKVVRAPVVAVTFPKEHKKQYAALLDMAQKTGIGITNLGRFSMLKILKSYQNGEKIDFTSLD